jgi:hypothetical protein
MRPVIARIFDYSLDGALAEEATFFARSARTRHGLARPIS